MQARLNYFQAGSAGPKAMIAFNTAMEGLGIDKALLHLIKLRASQINGCAFCIAMHTKEARADGEDQRRLDLLQSWHETTLFTEAEEAALAWTEALTRLADTHAPDDVYARLAAAFSEKECVDITTAIVAINGWNRFAVGFRAVPQA
ncbi:alkylhydroperoxidase [Acuticoccus sediminis]|uniref:Alkylhydroperoxidase n=1 Tax=Acuticoccus sediminis TaxID=2184697 RepID=A0A8B2NSC1_9HYPH|nr:carboxymuconolactone decarboxylase family protein [Acuticoccus sediminis]RAI00012.1 alkylhydroperoxidase [Acuticoccus sediminis]